MTEVSEKANTVDEYRAEIRETLEKRADANAERAFEDAVVDAVSDNAEVDIPKAMVDDEINAMLRDMEMRLAYQGMKLDDFVKYTGQDDRPAAPCSIVPALRSACARTSCSKPS